MSLTDRSSVLVLCGGRGRRLEHHTNQTPKVLVPVNGRPIITYILSHYLKQSLNSFIFATGYLSEQVERFAATYDPRASITISNSGNEASMLRRIYDCGSHFKDHVIVSYGDTFIDIDFRDLLEQHIERRCLATIVTGTIQNPFGVVGIDSREMVTYFVEKPQYDYYIGCFVFSRELLTMITPELLEKPDGQGLVELFITLSQNRQLQAYRHNGMGITFNTEQELHSAQITLKNYYTLKEM